MQLITSTPRFGIGHLDHLLRVTEHEQGLHAGEILVDVVVVRRTRVDLGGVLLRDRLVVLIKRHRRDEKMHFGNDHPLVEHLHSPAARPERLDERRRVVRLLTVPLHGGVERPRDVVGGVDPRESDKVLLPRGPTHEDGGLVLRAHESGKVAEHTLFGIKVSTNLLEHSEKRMKYRITKNVSIIIRNAFKGVQTCLVSI